MSENAVEKAQSFEERMKARIKDGIGDLLTDDEVKKLIDRGLEEVFFKPTLTPARDGWSKPIEGPSLLHAIVLEALQPIVTQCVKEYIAEHPEEVKQTVNNVISGGMSNALVGAVNSLFAVSLCNLQANIQNDLATKLQRPY